MIAGGIVCECCVNTIKHATLSEIERFKVENPTASVQLDIDVPEIAEHDQLEFRLAGMDDIDVVAHHWPVQGWTVSARWNPCIGRWERCRRWPTPERIAELKKNAPPRKRVEL